MWPVNRSFKNLIEMLENESENTSQQNPQTNIYWTIFKCIGGNRNNPVELEYYYIDLDSINTNQVKEYIWALGGFLNFDADAIAVIFTGRGLQCFIKIDTTITPTDFLIKRIAFNTIAYKFQDYCKHKELYFEVDTSVYDIKRVLRYPNTVNYNPGKQPVTAHSYVYQKGNLDEKISLKKLLDIAEFDETKVKSFENNYSDKKGKTFKNKKCIETLWNKPIKEGEPRHPIFFRLCVHEKNSGSSYEECKIKVENLCKISGLDPKIRGYQQLNEVYEKSNSYDFGCNDCYLSKHCSKECYLHPEKVEKRKEDRQSKADDFYTTYYDAHGKFVKVPEYYYMAEYFQEKLKLKVFESFSYFYNGKHYEQISDQKIENIIMELVEDYEPSPSVLGSFLKITKIKCFSNLEMGEFGKGLINLNNGIYDIRNKKLIPHSHEYLFVNCLPYDYIPESSCVKFDQFLNQIMLENVDLVNTIYEFMGYTLLGGDPFLHKAMICYGEGANGKSTLMKLMFDLFGYINCSRIKPKELDERFQAASLLNKIANICEELSSDKIESDCFKEVVGGAIIQTEFKGKPIFSFKNMARFIISTNQMPVFADTTLGLTRRLLMIPFNYEIDENDYNFNINKEFQAELPGIFNKCMTHLDSLLGRGRFVDVKASKEVVDEYKATNDSVYSFIKDFITIDVNKNEEVNSKQLYSTYCIFCTETLSNTFGKRSFEMRFARHIKYLCKELNVDYFSVKPKESKYKVYKKISVRPIGF